MIRHAIVGLAALAFGGVGRVYLRSRKFLQGDGGWAAVKWVSPKAYEAMKDLMPDGVEVGA